MVDSKSRHPQGQNGRSERVVERSCHDYLLAFVGENKRVLEFGCSSAMLAQQLSAAGCRVTAVASDAEVAAQARAWCERVVVCDLDTLPFSDLLSGETFEVVVFDDVLQQLRDPLGVLEETRGCLAPGGVVAISVPALAHGALRLASLEGELDFRPAGFCDETPLRSFTLKTLQELCLRAGFRIERLERTRVQPPSRSELIAEIESDRDPDTLQFVITATPLNEDDRYQCVLEELLRTRLELELEREKQLPTAASPEAENYRLRAIDALRSELEAEIVARATIEEKVLESQRRQEALECENAALRSALCELQRSIEDVRSTVALRDKDHERAIAWLRDQNRTLRTVQADLRERLSARDAAAAKVASLEAALAEREQFLDAACENAETLVRQNQCEIALTQGRIAEIDARLAQIHGSIFWKMKLRVLALRGRLRSLVHGAGG